jgi:Arc/MetJ-type ribon-helix-helix transcriptional regulator
MISSFDINMSVPEPKDKPILLRLPEHYVIALDEIVRQSKGKYKSRNELATEILGIFLSDLKNRAEDESHG